MYLIVYSNFESSGAPVNKLDGLLGLDGGDGLVHILRHNVSTVEQAAGHVLAVTRITLDHLAGGLEASICDLSNRQLFVVSLLCGDDWCVGHKWEMDARVWHQVGLELVEIDVQGTVETQRGSDTGHNLEKVKYSK